jgi:hypothetical protein
MKKILVILIFIALGGVAWGQIPLGSNFGLTSGIPLDNRTVKADLTERDAIPAVSRYEGLTVYVESEEVVYTLVGGITNSDWVEGSAGGVSPFPDTIFMDDYGMPDPFTKSYQINGDSVIVVNSSSYGNRLYNMSDTIGLIPSGKPFVYSYESVNLSSDDEITKVLSGFTREVKETNLKSSGNVHAAGSDGFLLYPNADDTIQSDVIIGYVTQIQAYTPEASSRVDVGEMKLQRFYVSLGSEVAVDSLVMIEIYARDTGIPDDSIGKVYLIKNVDGGLRGSDSTYFLYSEYGDNYLNGDLDVTGITTAKQFKEVYPDTVDMDIYYGTDYFSTGSAVFNPQFNKSYIIPNTYSKNNYWSYQTDSLVINDLEKKWTHIAKNLVLNGSAIAGPARVTGFPSVVTLNEFISTTDITGNTNGVLLWPGVDDTIKADDVTALHVEIQGYTPESSSYVDITHMTVMDLYASLDDYMQIDSLTMLTILPRNTGIPADSITAYYGIYHKASALGQEIYGKDKTYFLYSEYGDNYLNGDVTAKDFKYIYPATIDMDDYYNAGLDKSQYSSGAGTFTVATNSSDEHNVLFDRTDTILIGNEGSGTFKALQHTINISSSGDSESLILPHSDFVIFNDLETTKDIRVFSDNSMLYPKALDTIVMDQFELNQQRVLINTPATSRIAMNELIHTNKYVSFDDYLSVDSATFIQLRAQDIGIDPDSISKLYMVKNIDGGLRGSDKTYFLYSEYGDNYLNGDLDVHGRFMDYPYGAIDMVDYNRGGPNAWKYRAGRLDVTPSAGADILDIRYDTISYSAPVAQPFRGFWNWTNIDNFESSSNMGSVADERLISVANMDLGTGGSFIANRQNLYLDPQSEDTISAKSMDNTWIYNNYTTDFADGIVDIGRNRNLYLFGWYDEYVHIDSTISMHIYNYDGGADVDAYYGIYHEDAGLMGNDRTYFAYSEYGDLFLGGGGELDQYGRNLKIGADAASGWTTRNNDVGKLGGISMPHRLTAEEDIQAVGFASASGWNRLYLGGGSVDLNAFQETRILAASDDVTLSGTEIGRFDINGFHTDTIQELSTGEGISVKHDLKLFDGAELDQYGFSAIIGANTAGGFTSRTDAVAKGGMIVVPHYNTAEENTILIYGYNNSGGNAVSIGGGNGLGNAATSIGFYTAVNTTTTTGTLTAFLDSTSLTLYNGAELDQVGREITLGADVGTLNARTDDTQKIGALAIPQYDTDEENLWIIGSSPTETNNEITIGGGGGANYNTATAIRFMSASDNSSTTPTIVADVDINGFHADTISELTTDSGVYVEGTHFEDDDIEIAGAIKQTQLTGSLTDGAPSDAEIDTVTGTTPAAVGAGWQVTIKDNDGTGLLYRIESDGTNWFYMVMTQAS